MVCESFGVFPLRQTICPGGEFKFELYVRQVAESVTLLREELEQDYKYGKNIDTCRIRQLSRRRD